MTEHRVSVVFECGTVVDMDQSLVSHLASQHRAAPSEQQVLEVLSDAIRRYAPANQDESFDAAAAPVSRPGLTIRLPPHCLSSANTCTDTAGGAGPSKRGIRQALRATLKRYAQAPVRPEKGRPHPPAARPPTALLVVPRSACAAGGRRVRSLAKAAFAEPCACGGRGAEESSTGGSMFVLIAARCEHGVGSVVGDGDPAAADRWWDSAVRRAIRWGYAGIGPSGFIRLAPLRSHISAPASISAIQHLGYHGRLLSTVEACLGALGDSDSSSDCEKIAPEEHGPVHGRRFLIAVVETCDDEGERTALCAAIASALEINGALDMKPSTSSSSLQQRVLAVLAA